MESTLRGSDIVTQARGPALVTDGDGRIAACNEEAAELFGFSHPESLTGSRLYDLLELKDVFGNRLSCRHVPFFELALGGEPVAPFELQAVGRGGDSIRLSASVVVVVRSDSDEYELVYLLRRIQRRRKADEAIDRLLAHRGLYEEDGSPSNKRLTRRQSEVLQLMADGRTVREIAQLLELSPHTVRRHVQNILERLEVHSKTEAVSRAFREHLL